MLTSPAYVFDSWGPNKNEKTYVVTCDEHPRPITTKHNRGEAQKVADAHNRVFHGTRPFLLTKKTDNPEDPCGYCVSWAGDEIEDPESIHPVDPWGNPVKFMFSGIHPSCEQSVRDYEADRRRMGDYS